MSKRKIIKFKDWECSVHFRTYGNGRTAIELLIAEDDPKNECFKGEPVLVATVNCPEFPLGTNQVLIKNWSENEGILKVLIDEKIVKYLNYDHPMGYPRANLCELLPRIVNYTKDDEKNYFLKVNL